MKKKVPKMTVGLPSTKPLVRGLPEILKKQSRFSGGSSFGAKGQPVVKFTPQTFRITQHKGGGGK